MSLAFIGPPKRHRSVAARTAELLKCFHDEAASPIQELLLGHHFVEWARKTRAFQTWSGMTREKLANHEEELQYRCLLARELALHEREFLDEVRASSRADTALDLLFQLHDEGKRGLFCFSFGLELLRCDHGVPVHRAVLEAVHRFPDVYPDLDHLRLLPHNPDDELSHIWAELDEIREGGHEQLPGVPELSTTVRSDINDAWRLQEAATERVGGGDGQPLVRKQVCERWLALENRVRWSILHLVEKRRMPAVLKRELWDFQNRIEGLITNVLEQPSHPSTEAFRQHVKYFRPAFRHDMGELINYKPHVAGKVYEILEALMARESDAFGFLEAAAALARVRDSEYIVSEIQNDLLKAEPSYYKTPAGIIAKLERAAVYMPRKMEQGTMPMLMKWAVETGRVARESLGLLISKSIREIMPGWTFWEHLSSIDNVDAVPVVERSQVFD